MNREILFPTPIYFKMVKDPKKMNKYLFPLIKAWSKKEKSEEKTNAGGGWHSPTGMNKKKEYNPLIEELFDMQYEIYKDYGMEPKPGLGNMWANINYQGSYNTVHVHPNSVLSGSYYIQVPKKSGHIFFQDPRPGPSYLMPNRITPLPKILSDQIEFETPTGRCLMFPAWLHHGVTQNKSRIKGEKGWRISIAFNAVAIDK